MRAGPDLGRPCVQQLGKNHVLRAPVARQHRSTCSCGLGKRCVMQQCLRGVVAASACAAISVVLRLGGFFTTTRQPTRLLSAIVRCQAVSKFCCYLSWLPQRAQLLYDSMRLRSPSPRRWFAAAGVAMSLVQLRFDQMPPHLPAVAQGRPLAGERIGHRRQARGENGPPPRGQWQGAAG